MAGLKKFTLVSGIITFCFSGINGGIFLSPKTDINCQYDGQIFPDDNICSIYYTCYSYTQIYMSICPKGEVFDYIDLICKENGRCIRDATSTTTTKQPEETTTEQPAVCPVGGGDQLILLPNPSDCHSYFICDNGILTQMWCPPGLDFNPDLKVCDYPANANCRK